jgi:hypothetical protein
VKISEVYSSLISAYCDWGSILINPRYVRQGNTITWEKYQPKSFTDPIFSSNVIELIDEGQYSFQFITDGGIIQLYYSYDSKENLIGSNLAYISLNEDPNLPVGWLRIDYDPQNARGLAHPKCHMHWSLFPNSRMAIYGIPSPRQFIEFVICSFYPSIYQEKHLNEDGNYHDESRIRAVNSDCFSFTEESHFKYMSHFFIPASQKAKPVIPPNPLKNKKRKKR